MSGYVANIETKSLENSYFREVLFTGPHSQLVLMSLAPGEDIGLETHDGLDQFIRVEAGTGKALLDGQEHDVADGTLHNIINTSDSEALKLYTIYSPPEHPVGTVHKTKSEALAYEKEHHQ